MNVFMILQIGITFILTIVVTFVLGRVFFLTPPRYFAVFAIVISILNLVANHIRGRFKTNTNNDSLMAETTGTRDILKDIARDYELPERIGRGSREVAGASAGKVEGCPVIAL